MTDAITGGPAQPASDSPEPRRKLTDLTPAQIQEIGAKYQLVMTGVVGSTFGRVAATLAYAFVVFLLAMLATLIVTGILGLDSARSFWLLTLAAWVAIMSITYKLYLVNVPKLTGLLTTDPLTEELHVFGTGLGLKYPWERYTKDDYIDLTADIVEKTTRFVTQEGAGIQFPWSMQFSPYLQMLPLYVRTENRAISEGLEEVVETTFSASVLGVKIKDIRHPDTVDRIRKNMLRVLEGDPVLDQKGNEVLSGQLRDQIGYPIEERFAIQVELATLGAPVYDKDYQELLLGSLKATHIQQDAQKFARSREGWSGMSAEKATRQVMILNNEPGVTDESFTLDLTERAQGAAGDVGKMLQAGTAIARVVGNRNRGGRKRGGGKNPQTPPTPPAQT